MEISSHNKREGKQKWIHVNVLGVKISDAKSEVRVTEGRQEIVPTSVYCGLVTKQSDCFNSKLGASICQ